MPTAETAFWGDDVLITEALTPIAVMRQAAAQLPNRTKNLLEAEIESSHDNNVWVDHTFSIVAPGLDRYACPIFTVRHKEMLVYPTITHRAVMEEEGENSWYDDTEEELRASIRRILASGHVKAIIYSLLAKLNEAKPKSASKS
ncbi:MAG: hypothetical protein NTZ32_26075 [Planctomycetales bacterium]|nr:hypothetical protein [Planctomycetales bacterium]